MNISEAVLDQLCNTIKNYNILKDGVDNLLKVIQDNWHNKEWGFRFDGKRLELHTGGWSDNETIINALQQNNLFWGLYWLKSERGGHYYFEIKENKNERISN